MFVRARCDPLNLLRALLLIVGMHGAFGEEGAACAQAFVVMGKVVAANVLGELHLNAGGFLCKGNGVFDG